MVHLSNPTSIMIMCFYSLLTFFISPFLTDKYLPNFKYSDSLGFVLGFVISILLWLNFGKKYATKYATK